MIGIITFHSALNYGAVLQTYALQKKIEELGGESEVIDYRCKAIEKEYKWIRKKDCFPIRCNGTYVKVLIGRIFLFNALSKKRKVFKSFLENCLNRSESCYNYAELEKLQEKYHAVITGSDQVWNPSLTDSDGAYFLDFIKDNNKKYSYAASIGNMGADFKMDEEKINLLKQFEKISVREENGKKYIEEVVKRESDIHIDPTLTLNSDRWNEIAKAPQEKEYLLLYTVSEPIKLIESAKKIADKENLTIIYINDKVFRKDKRITYVTGVSPEEFVGYFKYAKYVMTNSFHGTAFSIIFKRKFLVELESSGGKNRRVTNLLESMNINNRELNEDFIDKYSKDIDWKIVEEKTRKQRIKAEDYLKLIIGNNK